MTALEFQALPVAPSLLGEAPTWHPAEERLYWCDIPGRKLHRFDPRRAAHDEWQFDCEPACCAPLREGGLILGMRDGLWSFDPASGERSLLAAAPYDQRIQRFNDGKADALGRFWVGSLHEPKDSPAAALYRYSPDEGLVRIAGGITTSNGLAFSPDGRTMYWADTKAHAVDRCEFDLEAGDLSARRAFARFEERRPGSDLQGYRGRPDGAAVDAEGAYWIAMFEGQRLLRIGPDGELLAEIALPVRCPTMPCFGGPDLCTLYVTTARDKRPAEELAAQPLAGRVLFARVAVAGLPAAFARI